ncbi:MAG: hypothetical protein PHF58_13505 [Methylotenera sp.]|nr:hypothetical protein [Methylotenera sp.]
MYTVKKCEIRNLFTQKIKKVNFEVIGEKGLYATLDTQDQAEVVAYGLNNNFIEHFMGGFSDEVSAEIKIAMLGGKPAAWAVQHPEN